MTVDPHTLREVLASIVTGGQNGASPGGAPARRCAAVRLERVLTVVAARARPRVAVLEWTDPPFTARGTGCRR